jgi:hypothetical protein
MKKAIVALALALTVGTAAPAAAGPITTLFNTGGVPGQASAHWYLGNDAPAYVTGPGFPFPYWLANDAISQWISPAPGYTIVQKDDARAYVFGTTFDIPGPFSSAQFVFRMGGDNEITQVRLNGAVLPGVSWLAPGPGRGDPYEQFSGYFTVSSANNAPFVQGNNILQFDAFNWPCEGACGNPAGLRVEFAESEMIPNPEPASLVLLGTGLVGLLGAVRRRRQK